MAGLIQSIAKQVQTKQMAIPAGMAIRYFGGQIVPYTDDKLAYIQKGYSYNDIVYSIIRLIVEKAKVAPWAIYTIKDQKAYQHYRAAERKKSISLKELSSLQSKALELYTQDSYLNDLLEWPNENETWADNNEGLWGYKLLTGDYFEYWPTFDGGLNAGKPSSLSGLPPQYMLIESGKTLPLTPEKYFLMLGGRIEFAKEIILHEKYFNPEWDIYGRQLLGQSPLKAALRRLQRNNEAVTAGAAAFRNGGVRGIVSYDDPRLDPNEDSTFEQMGKIKQSYFDDTRPGAMGAGTTAFSQYSVKYTQVGISPVDMQQLESENADMRFLCNVWGAPSQLLNDSAAKTYNTIVEAEKALTARCALPLLISRRANFNRKLNQLTPYIGKNLIADYDLTPYDELQPNKKEMVDWMEKSFLSIRRRYEILGEDIPDYLTEEELNSVPVPSGMTLLNELFVQPEDIKNAVDEVNKGKLNPYE